MNIETLTTSKQPGLHGGFVCPLTLAQATDRIGGKASNLGQMMAQGIPVPPGFAISDSAFQLFLDENDLRVPIETALTGLEANHLEQINSASQSIVERIRSAKIPDPVWESIQEMILNCIPGVALAVRSSAIGEDSHEAAFAGQLDSFLNIDSNDSLTTAILGCWASYWSPRVIFYQLSRGIYLQGMGVVIQKLVASQVSGILFTHNPDLSRGARDQMVVEYCSGHGDELAAGKINPGRFVISRDNFSWQIQATPEQDRICDDACLFDKDQIERLARAAIKLEDLFECPQDIEWTIDGAGTLYLVQTRPITVNLAVKQSLHDPEQAGHRPDQLVSWSNANVNENFPEPISPFLYSIASAGYYNYFRNLGLALGFDPRRVALMEYPLRNVIGVHGARMYYNLTNIHTLLRMAPGGELLAQWFDDFVGAQPASEQETAAWKPPRIGRWSRIVELGRTLIKTSWQFLFLSKRVGEFEQVVDSFAATTGPDNLESKSLSDLLEDLRSFIDIRCNRWTNASLADTAAMVTYGLLKRLLTQELPDHNQAGLHNSLLKGLRNVVSGIPIVELWNLSRLARKHPELQTLLESGDDSRILNEIRTQAQFAEFHSAFEAFLQNWGFRCSGELMLTIPSFQERPESLLEMIRAYVGVDSESPLELLERQASDRESETAKVLKQLRRKKLLWPLPWPTKATLLSVVLTRCHRSIALRERARLKQALLYSHCRRIALAIADRLITQGRLQSRNDIFMLTYQEVESLLAGSAMFPYQTMELIRIRKSAHQQLGKMQPEDAFVLPIGDYVPVDVINQQSFCESDQQGDQSELIGVGACGGQVTAPAAILTDISECRLLNEGDVLVTRQTDPGWGPVFFLIKGLVMERGGMLSHGAILAREYGIPTVVGVPQATQQISQGQKVTVNGDRGIVQRVD